MKERRTRDKGRKTTATAYIKMTLKRYTPRPLAGLSCSLVGMSEKRRFDVNRNRNTPKEKKTGKAQPTARDEQREAAPVFVFCSLQWKRPATSFSNCGAMERNSPRKNGGAGKGARERAPF